LARFADPDTFDDAVAAILEFEGVKRWDAVDGHYQIVVKLCDDGTTKLDKVKETFHLAELVSLNIKSDTEPDIDIDRNNCYSYLFVESDSEQREVAIDAIKSLDECFFVNATEGKYDLVVMLKSPTFSRIDAAIETNIAALDGVLRYKQSRVISSNPA
jgi:hypothetical protein